MSANNIVIIKKEEDEKFRGYHRDYDAYCEGQYDYEGICTICNGTNVHHKVMNGDGTCPYCDDNGMMHPPEEDVEFEADTIEGAIQAYNIWCRNKIDNDEFGMFYVEYGYQFEGLEPNDETIKALEESERGEGKIFETVEEMFEELDKPTIDEYQQAIDNKFCTKRGHQEQFLDEGLHAYNEGETPTPGGGGCIYCIGLRLSSENDKLREEMRRTKKMINWLKCLFVIIGISIGTIVGAMSVILFLAWFTEYYYGAFLVSLPSIFLIATSTWLYRKWYGAPRVCPKCEGSGKACSGGGLAATTYDCPRCNTTGKIKGSKL
jgi:hypothetical protein